MHQNNSGISLNELFEVSLPGFADGWNNLSLVICCKKNTFEFQYAFVANHSTEWKWFFPDPSIESVYLFPLFAHHENRMKQMSKLNAASTSNLKLNIVDQFAKKLGLTFTNDLEDTEWGNNSPVCYANSPEVSEEYKMEEYPQSFTPMDILDYVYAVLHSPKFKEKYMAELRKDFPVVPLPKNQITFWKLKALGEDLRKLHLLEGPEVEKYITQFPIEGKHIVNKIFFEENYEIINADTVIHMTPLFVRGRVYINETQFFQMVPKLAWELSFGNHKPAQQWLENKMGQVLKAEEIIHFHQIIVALFETNRICNEFDQTLL